MVLKDSLQEQDGTLTYWEQTNAAHVPVPHSKATLMFTQWIAKLYLSWSESDLNSVLSKNSIIDGVFIDAKLRADNTHVSKSEAFWLHNAVEVEWSELRCFTEAKWILGVVALKTLCAWLIEPTQYVNLRCRTSTTEEYIMKKLLIDRQLCMHHEYTDDWFPYRTMKIEAVVDPTILIANMNCQTPIQPSSSWNLVPCCDTHALINDIAAAWPRNRKSFYLTEYGKPDSSF